MVRRKTDASAAYTLLGINVSGFTAHIDASVSYRVRDPRHYAEDAKVYEFASSLEVEGACTYPEERAGDFCRLIVYGCEPRTGEFALTLADCHTRDDRGLPKYRKRGVRQVPVYAVPKGIGLLDRQRGTRTWSGTAWVSPQLLTDMLAVLPHVRPLYLTIQELKVERTRWIVRMTLQTIDPAAE